MAVQKQGHLHLHGTRIIIGGMIADPTEQRWMRVEEAAVYANVGVTYIRKLIRTRRLPAINTGRYYVIDRFKLDACLESLEPKRPHVP